MNLNLRNLELETRDGYCRCGCGEQTHTPRCAKSPNLFVHGHHNRCKMKYREIETGCWEWQTGTSTRGYGVARVNGRSCLAHRAVYQALVGPIPEGMVLDHTCLNTICVNPAHLQVVTQAENTRRGKLAKLSVDDVRNIRELYAQGVRQRDLVKLYGVTSGAVCNIVNRKSWRDV